MANKLAYQKRRVDANQKLIVATLEALGASVVSLHDAGAGVPDLLVGYRGITCLVEVKNPDTRGKLNDRQQEWHAAWLGAPIGIIYTPDQARDFLEALRL
jgi:hypothetical protein